MSCKKNSLKNFIKIYLKKSYNYSYTIKDKIQKYQYYNLILILNILFEQL